MIVTFSQLKKLLLTQFFLLASLVLFAQSFEGKITYTVEYESKLPQMKSKQWTSMLGNTQVYYIKGNRYKSLMNGQMISWQLYTPDENRLYTKMTSPDVAYWTDGSTNPDSLISFELHEGAKEILGYMCDELIFNLTSGKQTYYFTSELPVDPSVYANHAYGNWSLYLLHAKSLTLKQVVETEYFVSTSTAVEVSAEEIDDRFFEMDKDIAVLKSPN